MPLVEIKPVDNTFFRKGDPFDATINNHIESMDTPYNSTVFGAVFTALLTENEEFRNEFFKEKRFDHKEILAIKNIFLYDGADIYIKAPLNLFINEDDEVKKVKFEELKLESNFDFKYILVAPQGDYERVDDYYISVDDLLDEYIIDNMLIDLLHKDEIFIKNNKVGIKLNKEIGAVEESHLYSIEETEFRDGNWSYVVEYGINSEKLEKDYKNEIKALKTGYLKLGGENKVCRYKEISAESLYGFAEFKEDNFKANYFSKDNLIKVLFLQEVYFEENIKKVFSENDSLEIVGLSNSKPIYIGGYDMQGKGKTKIMYKGYSAGTILFIKVNEEISKDKIIEELDKRLKSRDESGAGKYKII